MSRRGGRRYNGQDLFDVADQAEIAGHPLAQPWEIPPNVTTPPRMLCAASGANGKRHRVGVEPLTVRRGQWAWWLCSPGCLAEWVARLPRAEPTECTEDPYS